MTESAVSQLRLVIEAEDYEEALVFFRDVLGLPEREAYAGDNGEKVSILAIDSATLELANPAQVRMIDDVEVGRPVARRSTLSVRVAFEVADAVGMTERLAVGGARVVAEPTVTPWNSLNARLETPGGVQVTVFQELAE